MARAAHARSARNSPPRGGTLLLHYLLANIELARRVATRGCGKGGGSGLWAGGCGRGGGSRGSSTMAIKADDAQGCV